MSAEEIEYLKEEIRGFKEEVAALRKESKEDHQAYKVNQDNYYEEYSAMNNNLLEIKNILYNDEKTGRKGLVQTVYMIEIEMKSSISKLTALVEKLIGDKDSKRRRLIKLWAVISAAGGIAWAVFKEFLDKLFHK